MRYWSVVVFSLFLDASSVRVVTREVVGAEQIVFSQDEFLRLRFWSGYRLVMVPARYRDIFLDVVDETGINPYILYRVITVESGWRRYAQGQNRDGSVDRGLMQINSRYENYFVGRFWGDAAFRVFEPEHNMLLGARIYQSLYMQEGCMFRALARYNVGSLGSSRRQRIGFAYAGRVLKNVLTMVDF